MHDAQDFLVLERGFWAAAGDPEGGKYYEDNFDDTGVLMLPFDGGMLDKASVVPMIAGSASWKKYDMINIRLVPIDDNSVELCYEVRASHGDDEFHAYVGSVYVRREGKGWKMLTHQQTPL